ncbi:hypothetical protein PENANT_c002G00170 [Penicillium antarcticum]|uniref:Uncharacterized protein n=1 Tax=Penicillium antarcticum TaxID=416450 RepID=A0A1V6QJQ1_9EURO|nr:uncharacterized protein N7508_006509 [Penicillium antarcticum]KAJ5301646.1 hypothetical protein N7508_006509 [Penicillium antarcticum]OQD89454.1 hypothetical protein PENANT_c002G00170 [Penicillium antarcticum]
MFHRRRNPTVTRTTKPTLMTRLKGRNARSRTVKTTTTTHPNGTQATHGTHATHGHHGHGYGATTTRTAPAHHHRRKASLGDKFSGAMMKLKGSLTHRPGVKAAGTRRMHGTDGRGSRTHRVY